MGRESWIPLRGWRAKRSLRSGGKSKRGEQEFRAPEESQRPMEAPVWEVSPSPLLRHWVLCLTVISLPFSVPQLSPQGHGKNRLGMRST